MIKLDADIRHNVATAIDNLKTMMRCIPSSVSSTPISVAWP